MKTVVIHHGKFKCREEFYNAVTEFRITKSLLNHSAFLCVVQNDLI